MTSIAIGADGLLVISHVGPDGALRITHCGDPACATSTSTTVTVAAGPGTVQSTSITVGTDGRPLIAFSRTRSIVGLDLFLARCDDPTIVIGADGRPVIAY